MTTQLVRVSCSGFLRIRDANGRVAFYYAEKNHRQILRPIGGSLQARPKTLGQLRAKFGARLFEENARDLRFVVPTDQLGGLWQWFVSREGRETDFGRLRHHLRRLGVLNERELGRLRTPFAYRTAHSGITAQTQVPIRATQYLVEVFDAELPDDLLARVLASATGSNRVLNFASIDDVQMHSGPGGYFSSLALTLFQQR